MVCTDPRVYHAQHVDKKRTRRTSPFAGKKGIANSWLKNIHNRRAGEHTQPQGRVETQTNQLPANEYIKEGKE